VFWGVVRLATGLLVVAGFLVASVACLYLVRFVVLVIVTFIPLVGKRHKHDRWNEMNAAKRAAKYLDAETEGGKDND